MIFSAALARYLVNFRQAHPEKESVCLDYTIASVMLPAALLGSLIGVELNVIFPAAILVIFVTLLLVSLATLTVIKAVQLMRKEAAQKREVE